MPDTLAQKVRAKYPGVYNQLSDEELEARVLAKYPGVYDGVPRTTAAPVDATVSAAAPPERGVVRRAVGAAASDLNPIPLLQAIWAAAQKHPANAPGVMYELAKPLVGAHIETGKKAIQAGREGRISEAVGYGAGAMLPIVGPAAARIGETLGSGQAPEAVGQAAALALGFGLPKAAGALRGSVKVPPLMRHPNPQMAETVSAGLEKGIPIDLGVASGNRAVQALEAGAEHTLAGSLASRRAAQRTAGALTKEAEALQGRAFPLAVSPEAAGNEALSVPQTAARARHGEANTAYTRLRELENAPESGQLVSAKTGVAELPGVTAEELSEVRRMLAELEEIQYTPRGMQETVGQGSTKEWTAGHRNAYVYEDIMNEAASPIPAVELRGRLAAVLGGERNNVWFDRALNVARKRLAGDRSVSKPLLPPEAGKAIEMHSTMQAPVNLAPVKARLAPIAKELEGRLSALQGLPSGMRLSGADRAAAETLVNVRRIMELPDMAPASAVDPLLSSLKKYISSGESPLARSRGQGVVAGVVRDLEEQLGQSLDQIGPEAVEALAKGREATKAKYAALEVGKGLGKKPVLAYRRLTQPGDVNVGSLREVAKLEPNLPPVLARAWLQRAFDAATAEGGFKHAPRLLAEWKKLGPETKRLLFKDPDYITDLSRFFTLAAEVTSEFNPSRSGTLAVAAGSVGGLAYAPLQTVLANLGAAGFASAMRSPAFVKAMTEGMRLPVRARAQRAASVERAMYAAREAGAGLEAGLPALAAERQDDSGMPTKAPSGNR